jgi:RNA polymerase sigma-70 factor (ECF subfamily)
LNELSAQKITELLNQVAQGDDEAATRLYRHYHGRVYAYVRHQIADEGDAEEIVHNVFLSLFRRPQGYRGDALFSTWLFAVAKNELGDLLRKQGGGPAVRVLDDDIAQSSSVTEWDFVARFEDCERSRALQNCLDALPREQKEVIFLVFYEGLGLHAVAQRQKCPAGDVKSRLFHARRRLLDCMSRMLRGVGHD